MKIVALTASIFKEEREKIMSAGMDDFVRKPFRTNEIYECMEKHLAVRFIYGDTVQQQQESAKIDPKALANLPQEMEDGLMNALVNLDTEEIEHAINRIADLNPALSKHLAEYTGRYQYTAIIKALTAAKKG